MLILGIETSCDETAAAVVVDGTNVLSSVVASQIDTHALYGGIVPEIASRQHIEAIYPVITSAMANANVNAKNIEGVAVTQYPGLVGSLLVGLSVAKAFAFARAIPLVGVNHLVGHICASFLAREVPSFPFIALVVSGGHTSIYLVSNHNSYSLLGQTLDDAAGEAFDKAAKLMGIGYPGGVVIDKMAKSGNVNAVNFPRAMKKSHDFSFSGLKTSLLNYLQKRESPPTKQDLCDIVASYQEAIVDVLIDKTIACAIERSVSQIVVCGGVAANSRLRERFAIATATYGMKLFIPPISLCTDNATMIAVAGYHLLKEGKNDLLSINAISRICNTVL